MQLPREVLLGKGAIQQIGEISRKLGFRQSALIAAGPKTYGIAGKLVVDLLEDKGLTVETCLVKSATMEDVEALRDRIRVFSPQVVFGVGGGTKIDVAKLGSSCEEVPFVSVPTTASHDGIASPLSSVKGSEKPYSVMAQAPIAIIADTEIIMHGPRRSIVSGCGDVMAKFTAVKDWKLAHEETGEYYGDYAASLALMSAKIVMENVESIRLGEEEGLRILLEALISCGVSMSIAGSSRPCSGSEHLFSHSLDTVRHNSAMHGEKSGVGTIMMGYLHGEDWSRIRSTLLTLGAPTNSEDLEVSVEDVVKALKVSSIIRPERYTILNKLDLKSDDCEKLARATGVI